MEKETQLQFRWMKRDPSFEKRLNKNIQNKFTKDSNKTFLFNLLFN